MLIDYVKLNLSAGKGGDGVVRWRREKGIPFGGPAGGDGGKGGDLYIRVVRDVHVLKRYIQEKNWKAPDGESGQKRSMHGASAEDLYIDVPVGSIVRNVEYDITYECNTDGEVFKVLKGGKGGLGNEKFKSATNRTPMEFTKGTIGEFATFEVELKLFAHVGFIGFPNAGKSSLLNALTRAGAKVADYAFTTLEPNLGAFHGYILADIPGLIEGASEGKGLGHKFLRHITRTQSLLHLIDGSSDDVIRDYDVIKKELENYDKVLTEKNEVIVLSKIDQISKEDCDKKRALLEKHTGKKVYELSLFDDVSVHNFMQMLRVHLDSLVISIKPKQEAKEEVEEVVDDEE